MCMHVDIGQALKVGLAFSRRAVALCMVAEEPAAYPVLTGFFGFFLGSGVWSLPSTPVASVARAQPEDHTCEFSGCSPDDLRRHISTLSDLGWWRCLALVEAALLIILSAVLLLSWGFLVVSFPCRCRRLLLSRRPAEPLTGVSAPVSVVVGAPAAGGATSLDAPERNVDQVRPAAA